MPRATLAQHGIRTVRVTLHLSDFALFRWRRDAHQVDWTPSQLLEAVIEAIAEQDSFSLYWPSDARASDSGASQSQLSLEDASGADGQDLEAARTADNPL